MDDFLTHLLALAQFAREQWPWVLIGVLGLYLLWHRNTVSALPSGHRRGARRFYNA